MKFHSLACLAVSSVLILPIFSEKVPAETSLKELVEQLGSDSYQLREEATKLLWEKGDDALGELENAVDSEDPEAALRAAEVLDLLELGLTPKSPERFFSLIEIYRGGSKEEKQFVLNELKGSKGYRQVLVLYSKESAEMQEALRSLIRGVAIVAAREAIFRNEDETAMMLLGILPNEPFNLMALASMHVSKVGVGGDLSAIDPPKNVSPELWKMTLLRARGDIDGAAEAAANANNNGVLAIMKMLQGDPTHWMRLKNAGQEDSETIEVYEKLALKRWAGASLGDADFEPLLKSVNSSDGDDAEQALASLALLGRLGEVEEFQKEANPVDAFVYYLTQERIPEALAIMGLNPKNPDYVKWFSKRMKALDEQKLNDDIDLGNDLGNEIAQMAGFLERRGLGDELADALTGPLEKFAMKREAGFLEFSDQFLMTGKSAPVFSFEFLTKWAGEDEERWREVSRISLGEDQEVIQWYDWVRAMKPEQTRKEALEVTRVILGVSTDLQDLRSEWFEIIWKAIKALKGEDQKRLAVRFLDVARTQGDAETVLRIYDFLGPLSAPYPMDRYLSAAGRWKEAAEAFVTSAENSESSSPGIHAFLAANYRRAGMEKKAAIHDRWVEKLTLGLPQSCLINARYYSYGGDYERSALWKKRAVVMADPSEFLFISALDSYAKSMMDAEEWGISASCYEGILHAYSNLQSRNEDFISLAKIRLKADFVKAMTFVGEDRPRAISLFKGAYQNFKTDGILADDFFPILRKAGLEQELEEWFGQSWAIIYEVLRNYPGSNNTVNTAAWLASRAGLKLKEAEGYLLPVLEKHPNIPAYLDTMAELRFAQGKRKEAVKWSNRAVMFMPQTSSESDIEIRAQNDRFKRDPLPK